MRSLASSFINTKVRWYYCVKHVRFRHAKSHASHVRLTHLHLTHEFPPGKILSRAFFCEVMHNCCIPAFTKIIKIVATIYQILRPICTKFNFGWDSAPDPTKGAYSTPPNLLADVEEDLMTPPKEPHPLALDPSGFE